MERPYSKATSESMVSCQILDQWTQIAAFSADAAVSGYRDVPTGGPDFCTASCIWPLRQPNPRLETRSLAHGLHGMNGNHILASSELPRCKARRRSRLLVESKYLHTRSWKAELRSVLHQSMLRSNTGTLVEVGLQSATADWTSSVASDFTTAL